MDEYSGLYIKNGALIDEKDVYHHEKKDDFCIWWHKQNRHWWLGKCKDITKIAGNAHLNTNKICPYEGKLNKTIIGYVSYSGEFQCQLQRVLICRNLDIMHQICKSAPL